jgi:hypothetical protein
MAPETNECFLQTETGLLIFLRDQDQHQGLCNGTGHMIVRFEESATEATILTGAHKKIIASIQMTLKVLESILPVGLGSEKCFIC